MATQTQQRTTKKKGGTTSKKSDKSRKAKKIIEDLQGVKPIKLNVPKPKNFGERAVIARDMEISATTLYNWEKTMKTALPAYFAGLSLLLRKGEGKKEYPDLTPYQQFCLRQLNSLRKSLDAKNCEANSNLIQNNPELFSYSTYEQEELLKIAVISSETVE